MFKTHSVRREFEDEAPDGEDRGVKCVNCNKRWESQEDVDEDEGCPG